MVERLLSVHDVSSLTGWSSLTIYKKAAAGDIPGRVIIGKRSLRFKRSEVAMCFVNKVLRGLDTMMGGPVGHERS